MKVLFHLLDAGIGGGQLVAARVAAELVRRGDDVTLAVPADGPAVGRFRELGAIVLEHGVDTLRRPQTVRRLARIVAEHDLLYSHTAMPGVILGGAAARLARRPHVVHQHTFPYFSTWPPARALQRLLLPQSARHARFIAVACHVRAGLIAAGIGAEQITVVPNGVPRVAPAPVRTAGEVVAGMVARLDPGKNVDVFLDAAAAARPRTPLRVVVAATSGPFAGYEARVRELATANGVEIRTVGDSGDFLQELDIVAIPSAYEGSPLVLLEAMSLARAVVASDIDGMREVIGADGGVLVPPGDVTALTGELERLADDPARRAHLGSRAAEIVAERYRLDMMLERTLGILDTAVSTAR
jgi:glycosyltransferase involved in cell wall biosynthesis